MKIVVCSNFNEDYFEESFINLPSRLPDVDVASICKIITNRLATDSNPVYWRCVPDDYKLQKGLES